MQKKYRMWFVYSCSDNRKSKIANPKWLGFSVIVFVLAMCGAVAQAQQPKKVPRIGYLSSSDAATDSARAEGIRRVLREAGHIKGQNIVVEYRYARGKIDRFPELVAELVGLKVDVIVVLGGTPWIQAAKNATTRIPIVMSGPRWRSCPGRPG